MRYLTFTASLCCSLFVAGWLVAADQSGFPGDSYRCIGKIAPRDARDIHGSNWSVGAETMDRDYTVYKNWKQYLGPLGVKHARIQSGWAKTEKEKGVYDWAWLDEIVDDMIAQGVTPWVCICYGNSIYPEGGDTRLNGWPRGEEALAAWDRYVAALVKRYRARVSEWEIWNEPGVHLMNDAKTDPLENATDYADFFIRTATIVRREQPTARILGLSLPKMPLPYAKHVLERLKEKNALGLLDELTYHPYNVNPDSSYDTVEELRTMLRSYAPQASIRQGENGCPSAKGGFGALASANWNETGQAKWALRRLLGDLGRDIPSSYFGICDMLYHPGRMNHKGLLAINEDKTVHHAKEAYYAVQNLTAIFDDTVRRVREFTYDIEGGTPGSTYTVFAYRKDEANMLVLWRNNDRPGANPRVEHVTITLPPAMWMVTPVLVDLRTGKVYQGPVKTEPGVKMTLSDVPVYDSPIVLAHLGGLPFAPSDDPPCKTATPGDG